MSITIQFFASAIAGLILGILAAWQLSLVTIAISPVLAVTSVLILKVGYNFDMCFTALKKQFF